MRLLRSVCLLVGPLVGLLVGQQPVPAEPLAVCATTSDLGALAAAVGGDDVAITVLAGAADDPHFVEARPSMIRAASRADVLLEVGLELEVGWLPLLVDNARNAAILPGAGGRIDASAVIERRGVPTGPVDRSQGDVHAGGNPHYLADPRCGLRVAALLRERFAALRPAAAERFAAHFARFRAQMSTAMVGAAVAELYDHDADRLALAFERGTLGELLRGQGDLERLGGWFGVLLPLRGSKVVADHDLWPYFAARFGLQVVGLLEPKPGIAPTTAHLATLVERMRADEVRVLLIAPYFARRHAETVARATGAQIVELAHQVGGRPGCTDYLATIDHNVRAVAAALAKGKQ